MIYDGTIFLSHTVNTVSLVDLDNNNNNRNDDNNSTKNINNNTNKYENQTTQQPVTLTELTHRSDQLNRTLLRHLITTLPRLHGRNQFNLTLNLST